MQRAAEGKVQSGETLPRGEFRDHLETKKHKSKSWFERGEDFLFWFLFKKVAVKLLPPTSIWTFGRENGKKDSRRNAETKVPFTAGISLTKKQRGIRPRPRLA